MAPDNVDLRFLGEQMQQMQSDLRQVRADQLRLESEQVQIQDRLARLESKVTEGFKSAADHFRSIDARFDQVFQTVATNTKILLDAITSKAGR
jgi:predicted nuclease with TOPRIM domain